MLHNVFYMYREGKRIGYLDYFSATYFG